MSAKDAYLRWMQEDAEERGTYARVTERRAVSAADALDLPVTSEDGRYVLDISPSDLGGYYVGDVEEGASLGNFSALPEALSYFRELTK